MTEAKWLALDDPEEMLLEIRDRVSDRKMRHFALACARRVRDRVTDSRGLAALVFAERFADVGVARRKGRGPVAKAAKEACYEALRAHYNALRRPNCASLQIAANALHAVVAPLEP